MDLFEKIGNFFKPQKQVTVEDKKAVDEIGRVIAPVFREIPPDSKQGKFLTEGLRSWAYIAITAIADEISTTTLNLLKKQKDEFVMVDENQALTLLEKPNEFQTKEEFLWLTTVFLLAEGEAPWYLDNAKNPTNMVLLNPYNLTVLYDESSIIGGYNYKQTNGVTTKIDKEQIIFLKLPNFSTPFRGMGIMKYIAQTLDIDNFIEEYLKLFFYNDTTPGAVLETEQELNDTILKRLKSQFQTRHQGVKNSHRLAVLEKGIAYKKISSNINELQLKELNDIIRDKILAAFKVPKSILGIVEDVNRANGEASDYSFSRRAILPKLKMIEGQLNQFLLPKFGEGKSLLFQFENPVEEDKINQAKYWQIAVTTGWLTKDEVREELGLEPLEEEEADDNIDEEEEPIQDEENMDDEKKIRKRPTKSQNAFVEVMKDILRSEEKEPKKEFNQEELIRYHDDKIMFLDLLEKDYQADLRKNFRRQKRYLLEQLKGKSIEKGNSINLTLDDDKEVEAMIKLSFPFLLKSIEDESKLAYAILGLQGTLSDQDAVVKTYLSSRTVKLGKTTTKTTQGAVDRMVKDWAEKEESWTVLRKDLSSYFDDTKRAELISRTELSNATGFAQQEVYKEAGAVSKKWITAQDERVCPFCMEMNGKTVAIEKSYFNKGESLTVAGGKTLNFDFDKIENANLHPGCRCDIIAVFEESKNNMEGFKKDIALRNEEIEKSKELELKEKRLSELELKTIEKEQENTKKEIELKKKIKEQETEIEKVKEYSKKLDE